MSIVNGIETVQVACLPTEEQILILVHPSFAKGTYGHCSIWLGLDDRKLYLRKLQSTSGEKPRDITHHILHPDIPRVVGEIKHGRNPCTKKAKHWWSTIHEFVDSETLEHVLRRMQGTTDRFPEPAIWQCGATLLDILRQMRFPEALDTHRSHALAHDDIYPRNILVSEAEDAHATNFFHLIDFGVATLDPESVAESDDLKCISASLLSMMVGRCTASSRPAGSGMRAEDRERIASAYSKNLQVCYDQLSRISYEKSPKWQPTLHWLDQMILDFREGEARSRNVKPSVGRPVKIPIPTQLAAQQPLVPCWWGSREQLLVQLRDHRGCWPFWIATMNLKTLELLSSDKNISWPRGKRVYSRSLQ